MCIAGLGCFFGAGLPAAQPAEPPPVRFTVFSLRPVKELAFVARPGGAPQQVVFYPTARSPRYEFRGPMPVRFVEAGSGAVVAEATIPPAISEALLLFVALDTPTAAGLRFQIAVLDDGGARHGAGGMAIVNLSGLELSGVVGRHAVILKSGLHPALAVSGSTAIALRAAHDARTYPSYSDQLEMEPGERALLLLFPPYYPGSLEVQSRLLVDRPPVSRPARATPP